MGTTSSRRNSSFRTPESKPVLKEWSQGHVDKLIAEKKLAPKQIDETNSRDAECPICFMNYEELNTVTCCKQHICTDCFVQLKTAVQTRNSCPFCENTALIVKYTENGRESRSSASSAMSNRELFSGEEEKNAGSKEYSQVSSPESIASTSSGFFDRGKKTRSQSLDEYNTRVIPKSSRSDRLALEQQIKEQRDKYQEDSFSAGMQLDGDRYNHNSTNSRRSASVSLQSPSINGRGFRYRRFQGSYSDPRATASQSHSQNANIMGARLFEERDALVNSIQGIFGESERRVTTIEELEDLMLMEAIKQSMRESQPSSSTTLDNESVDNQLQHSDHMKEDNSDNSSDVTGKISAKEHDNQIDKNNADLEQVTFKLTEDKEMKKLEDAVVTAPTLEKEKSIVKIGTDTTDDLSTVDNKNAESLAPGDVLTPQRLIDEIELVLNSSPNIANTDVKHNLVIISTEAANADEIEDKGK